MSAVPSEAPRRWVIQTCPTCGGLPEHLGGGRWGCGRHLGTRYVDEFKPVSVREAQHGEQSLPPAYRTKALRHLSYWWGYTVGLVVATAWRIPWWGVAVVSAVTLLLFFAISAVEGAREPGERR